MAISNINAAGASFCSAIVPGSVLSGVQIYGSYQMQKVKI